MDTFADKVIEFYRNLEFKGTLPEGTSLMNPVRDNPLILDVISSFYLKFFSDTNPRHIILGINPGRFGAGVTGIPFTDSVRLKEKCGIKIQDINTSELSSEFFYEMIDKYGGVTKFYNEFYVGAVSPLGFTVKGNRGNNVNCNYYDSRELTNSLLEFIAESTIKQVAFGIKRDKCFCLGTGKNFKFLSELNEKHRLFEKIIPLEHPRYIMQYRLRTKMIYIEKYTTLLEGDL